MLLCCRSVVIFGHWHSLSACQFPAFSIISGYGNFLLLLMLSLPALALDTNKFISLKKLVDCQVAFGLQLQVVFLIPVSKSSCHRKNFAN